MAVLDYGVKKSLCEKGTFELSSEHHEPDQEGAGLEKNNLRRVHSQAKTVGGRNGLGTFREQKEGGCGRGRVGKEERGKDTGHLEFLPSGSHECCHECLRQIWTFSRKSVFCFCFTFSWQVKNMKNKDKRLKIMNEILTGIKVRHQA